LHGHHRCLSRDRDGLLQRTDAEFGVDWHVRVRRNLNAVALAVLNPVSTNVTVYTPDARSTIEYDPGVGFTAVTDFFDECRTAVQP